MTAITRRHVLGGSALAAATIGGLGLPRSARAETRLRLFWWGNPERDKRTFAAVDLYKSKRPDVAVAAEAVGWNDYWPKMATQAAGKNLPDVVQMDYRYLFEYARRNQLEPLDGFIGKGLDLAEFDATFLDSGRVDGKLYAVPMGGNSTAMFVNTAKLAPTGLKVPDPAWTWDDLRSIAAEIRKAYPQGAIWPVADKGHQEQVLEVFVRQRGKSLYDDAGRLGYGEADLADFFALWDGLRRDGLTPPADVTSQDGGGLDVLPLTLGKAVIDMANSNQLVALQALNKDALAMTMLPNLPGGGPGQYLKPAMLVSLATTSPAKAEAARLASFLVTDLDAAAILRVERGVPGDRRVRQFLSPKVEPLEKAMVDYLEIAASRVGPLPPPPPKGAGEIEVNLRRFYPQVAFGKLGVKEAAAQFYREAQVALRRA
jgi:multiple sugar transport system substrate-binding protein